MRLSAYAVLCAALCAPVLSQQRNNAGLGTVKRAFNATEAVQSGDQLLAGIAFLNGNTYVSGGGAGGVPMIYELDGSGVLLSTVPAPTPTLAVGGIRDMATDGTNLLGGSDLGVFVFDTAGNMVNTVVANNGPQPIVQPIAGPGLPIVSNSFRGVAYDPGGNSGNGSLFVGNTNFTDPILEIDLSGNILTTYPNSGWSCSGLAIDSVTGNLWCMNDQGAGTIFSRIIELSRTNNLVPTGNAFEQERQGPLQGGLDGIPGGDPATYASQFDLVALNRLNGEDWVVVHRVHLYPALRGYNEAVLQGSVNTGPLTTGALGTINPNDTLNYQISAAGVNNGSPAWIVFNLGRDSMLDGVTVLPFPGNPVFPELRAQNPLSQPRAIISLIVPTAVGAPATSLNIPGGLLPCFRVLRLQAIYIEPMAPFTFPFVATNEIWANGFDEPGCDVVVEASGANNSAIGATAFWRILHKGGPAIAEVTFDIGASSNPVQRQLMTFDLDNPFTATPAAFFDAGNATGSCTGTYRGSDVATGLVYDAQNWPANPCAVGANSGFIAQDGTNNPVGGGPNQRRLTFRFTSFGGGTPAAPVVFEFDADTDGGLGVDGASMAGIVVTFTLANGQVMATELFPDPGTPQRSVGGF